MCLLPSGEHWFLLSIFKNCCASLNCCCNISDSFNQEVLTLMLAVFCLFGFFFWCVCHSGSLVKIQTYLVPAPSQSFLWFVGVDSVYYLWLVTIREYDQGFDPVYYFNKKHLCSVVSTTNLVLSKKKPNPEGMQNLQFQVEYFSSACVFKDHTGTSG